MISQGLFRTCKSWICFLSFSVFVVVMCLMCLLITVDSAIGGEEQL